MSDSFLSQEEVDALLEGVTGESQRSEVVEVDLGQVRSYDISSQERIVRGRMPTMEMSTSVLPAISVSACSTSFAAAPRFPSAR